MTRDQIVELCERQLEAWNAHDPGGVGAVFASDATLQDAGGESVTGRDAIAARAKGYIDAFPDLQLQICALSVDGNKYALEWRASGTNTGSLAGMPPTNKSVLIEGCDVAEVGDDGLVHREMDYWNEASMMRQLGVMPEPAAATA
jgi:steroid delta-isomerase-like uncharacterized protein